MIADCIHKMQAGEDLSPEQASQLFGDMLDGKFDPAKTGDVLIGLAQKGETSVELAAAALAMRARMTQATVRADAIDVCGTGGDGGQTLNISTAVALVVAACDVPVAKHGNRAASSQSGASDVLSALGVNINAPRPVMERCVNELGIGYFAAPLYHPALAALMPIRKSLGIRTIFNLLGPLCNPAAVSSQLIGVADVKLIDIFIDTTMLLGLERATVVSGHGPMDEFSLSGTNHYRSFVHKNKVDLQSCSPCDFGFDEVSITALKGGTPAHNAERLHALLSGERGPYYDIVVLNAAFALDVARPTGGTLMDYMHKAREALDSGKAKQLLQRWTDMSHQL